MDLSYNTINLFPCIVQAFDISDFGVLQKQLIDYAYELRDQDTTGRKVSNRGGWQSELYRIKNDENTMHNFLIDFASSIPSIKKEEVDIVMWAWININGKGHYNVEHAHPSSDLAGVFWIKIPDTSGKLCFNSPNAFEAYNEILCSTDDYKDNNLYHQRFDFDPKEGRILVFPAHLRHYVSENMFDGDRISISFNLELTHK